ncbi:MAG: hypothetical protein KAI26_00225 [Nanoarchaeota archaeon]|nr:hypothetical protein [Nanoarchaeota archaeon]
MAEQKTLSDVINGESNEELVLKNVVLGCYQGQIIENSWSNSLRQYEKLRYFAFDSKKRELVVEIAPYPGFNVDFNNMLIEHYQKNNIPVEVKGGSKKGVLYIKEAFKQLENQKMVLVSCNKQGHLYSGLIES